MCGAKESADPGGLDLGVRTRFAAIIQIMETFIVKPILFVAATALTLAPSLGSADEISDTLEAALEAYNAGDVAFALEELDFARQKMLSLQANAFQQFLPEAPEGWFRDIDTEMAAGLAMMGGGMGAGAEYRNDGGSQYYSVTMMADNPMVVSMGAMFSNAAVMGMRVERVGRQRVAVGEDQAIALVDNRVLVQVEGDDEDLLLEVMGQIDFEALSNFGR